MLRDSQRLLNSLMVVTGRSVGLARQIETTTLECSIGKFKPDHACQLRARAKACKMLVLANLTAFSCVEFINKPSCLKIEALIKVLIDVDHTRPEPPVYDSRSPFIDNFFVIRANDILDAATTIAYDILSISSGTRFPYSDTGRRSE